MSFYKLDRSFLFVSCSTVWIIQLPAHNIYKRDNHLSVTSQCVGLVSCWERSQERAFFSHVAFQTVAPLWYTFAVFVYMCLHAICLFIHRECNAVMGPSWVLPAKAEYSRSCLTGSPQEEIAEVLNGARAISA